MKFSAKEQYGLRVMVELARHHGEGPISLAQVAGAEQLPLPYLEQIVMPLRRAGLLNSLRGAHGGYMLARRPQDINVGDIIRALEGAIVTIPCVTEESGVPCGREDICAVRAVWEDVRARVVAALGSMTLAGLLDGSCCQTGAVTDRDAAS